MHKHLHWKEVVVEPVSMALDSFFFHCSATSFARGSSGLGADSKACMESSTVLICSAGLHLSAPHTHTHTHTRKKTSMNY